MRAGAEGRGDGRDVFSVFSQGRYGEGNRGKAEGKLGQERALASQLAQGDVTGDEQMKTRCGA